MKKGAGGVAVAARVSLGSSFAVAADTVRATMGTMEDQDAERYYHGTRDGAHVNVSPLGWVTH